MRVRKCGGWGARDNGAEERGRMDSGEGVRRDGGLRYGTRNGMLCERIVGVVSAKKCRQCRKYSCVIRTISQE